MLIVVGHILTGNVFRMYVIFKYERAEICKRWLELFWVNACGRSGARSLASRRKEDLARLACQIKLPGGKTSHKLNYVEKCRIWQRYARSEGDTKDFAP